MITKIVPRYACSPIISEFKKISLFTVKHDFFIANIELNAMMVQTNLKQWSTSQV